MSDLLKLTPQNPWLGLASYQKEHRAYFFGRRREEEDLFERVRRHRLTVLYGPSGLGKTSLLNAGLTPRLEESAWLPIRVRLTYPERKEKETTVEAEPAYLIAQVLEHLLHALTEAGHPAAEKLQAALQHSQPPSLWELWHDTTWGLREKDAPRPVLLFDQFEEIFTLGEDEARARTAAAVLRDALADLIEDRPPPALERRLDEDTQLAERFDFTPDSARVVIVLREDYLARLERWKKVLPSLLRNRQELRLLDGPRALEAVTGPARIGRPPGQPGLVTDTVGAAIVRAVSDVADDRPLEEIEAVPPLLSLLCRELNERRLTLGLTGKREKEKEGNKESPNTSTSAASLAPSSSANSSTPSAHDQITLEMVQENRSAILQRYYDECFTGLPEAVRTTVEDELLSPGGYRESVGFDTLVSRLQKHHVPDPDKVLIALVERRLITAEERGGRRRVELTHDVLASIADHSRVARLERDALSEVRQKRLLIRRKRLRFAIVAGSIAVTVMLGVLTLFAAGASRRARLSEVIAITNEKTARENARKAAEASETALKALTETREAHAKLQETQASQKKLLFEASQGDHEAALRAIEVGNPSEALAYFHRSLRNDPGNTAALTASANFALGPSSPGYLTRSVAAFDGPINVIDFSPDGRWLAAGSGDNTLRVLEPATGKEVSRVVFENAVNSVSFSPDGRWLAVGSGDITSKGILQVVEPATGKEVSRIAFENAVNSVSFSPDGRWLAAGSGDSYIAIEGALRVFEPTTGKEVSLATFKESVGCLNFSPDSRYLAAGYRGRSGNSGKLRVMDPATGKEVSHVVFDGGVNSVSFSPDSRSIAACGEDNTLRVVEPATGKEVSNVVIEGGAGCVGFSPDGRWLASGGWNRTLRVVEPTVGNEISLFFSNCSSRGIKFSPDGRWLTAASGDCELKVVEPATGKEVSRIEFTDFVSNVSFSADSRWLAACCGDVLRVVEPVTGKEVSRVDFEEELTSVSFSPDGRWLAAASGKNGSNGTLRLMEPATGKEVSRFAYADDIVNLNFSPDGRWLAAFSGSDGGITDLKGTLWVVDPVTGKEVSRTTFDDPVQSVCFSLEGRWLAAYIGNGSGRVGSTGTLWVVDPVTGKEVSEIGFDDSVNSVCFSPNGRWLVVGTGGSSSKGTLRVVDPVTGKEVARVAFKEGVISVSFSPDGRWLAADSHDKTLRVWDARWLLISENEASQDWSDLLSFLSAKYFESGGRLESLTAKEKETLSRKLHFPPVAEEAQRVNQDKSSEEIFSWLRASPEQRTVSPWIEIPLRQQIGERLLAVSDKDKGLISTLADRAPWHPLVPISLARFEPKEETNTEASFRKKYLVDLTLKRLAQADETLYGKDTLLQYHGIVAEWLVLELGLIEEGLKQAEATLAKQPDNPNALRAQAKAQEIKATR